LSQHPAVARSSHEEAMKDLVGWLYEQDFGQPALA
jgi:hypothetical protein